MNTLGENISGYTLSPRNCTLLFMIWLRCYPSYHFLPHLFDVSVTTIHDVINRMMPVFHTVAKSYITRPSVDEWRSKMHVWPNYRLQSVQLTGPQLKYIALWWSHSDYITLAIESFTPSMLK
jgi:hypothetical protein